MELKKEERGFVTETAYGSLHVSSDEQQGFRPFQLMATSVAGCSAIVLNKVMAKMRMPCDDIKVSVQVERNEAEANRIERIQLHFVICGQNLKKDKVERAMALARKNCPMVQSVKNSIDVTETFEIVE